MIPIASSRHSAENGAMSLRRSAEHGFMSLPRSAENGFTLVELLVALFIFALLASAGVAILAFSVRAQAAASDRLDEIAGLGRVGAIVSADMAQVTPRATRNRQGDPLPAFDGVAVTNGDPFLSFVRTGWTNAEGAARASLQRVEYQLVDGRLERVPFAMLDGAEPITRSVLLDNIDRISVRYRVDNDWMDVWQPTRAEALPRAMELTVRRRDGVEYRQLFLIGTGY